MKKTKLYAALLATAVLTSCHENNGGSTITPHISGYVVEINGYGQPVPNFTPEEMKQAGFEYTDLINITIGNETVIDSIPFLTSYNETGFLDPTFVDYNAKGTDYGFGLLGGNFSRIIGGKTGDQITMTLAKKDGYKDMYEILKSVYPDERRSGETAEEYANFRMINTSGIADGIIYRSSNPLNCTSNPGRYRVVDSLAQEKGIKTEIDLADTEASIEKYMATEGYASTYCPQLYREGNVLPCGLSADFFGEDFKKKVGDAIKFMIAHEPPYLIHCNEGKDRCGFVSLILEALAGADIEEIRNDYMVTMLNFYKISYGDTSYNLRQKISVDRMIWTLCHENTLQSFTLTDRNNFSLLGFSATNLQAAAKRYLKAGGVTNEECNTLIKILGGQQ